MIISHEYRFIFVKTLKTAGTSIETYLSGLCGEGDIFTPIYPSMGEHIPRNYKGFWNPLDDFIGPDTRGNRRELSEFCRRQKFYNHISARRVKRRISSKVWQNYFKFCVERNPWEKTLSDFAMTRDRTGGKLTLDQYLENGRYCFNYPKYCDDRGAVMVDRVVQYETLNEELGEVFSELGVPFDGSLNIRAKSEHRPDRTSYRDILTEHQRVHIQRVFEFEIKLHGYLY